MRLRFGTVGVVIAFALALALPGAASAADASVSINNFAFTPRSVTIAVGDTVTWTQNQRNVVHTTTHLPAAGQTRQWDSGRLSFGSRFAHTFNTAGTFNYRCNIHTNMRGTVTVN